MIAKVIDLKNIVVAVTEEYGQLNKRVINEYYVNLEVPDLQTGVNRLCLVAEKDIYRKLVVVDIIDFQMNRDATEIIAFTFN
jgi:hypothetical protein